MRQSWLLVLAACAPSVPGEVGWVEDVEPIARANCGRCHGSPDGPSLTLACFRTDQWFADPAATAECAAGVAGVVDVAPEMVRRAAVLGDMPPSIALTDRQRDVLAAWEVDGFRRRRSNAPPTIEFVTPPVGGVTVDVSYVVQYVVADADGDPVTWSLTYDGGAIALASGLREGTGSVTIDTSVLATGSYRLAATLDDGSVQVTVLSAGTLDVPPGRNARPTVIVLAPNGGEIYQAGTAPPPIRWQAQDLDSTGLTVDLAAIHGAAVEPIAAGVAAAGGSFAWSVDALPPATDYRIRITVHDNEIPDATNTDESDATWSIAPPPQVVSFSAQLQPIFAARCGAIQCHDAMLPAGGLNLTPAVAYAQLAQPSADCPATRRVEPGQPDASYLVHKLVGAGPCFIGSRMPKGGTALSAAEIQLFRDWITNGVPDN